MLDFLVADFVLDSSTRAFERNFQGLNMSNELNPRSPLQLNKKDVSLIFSSME